MNKYIPQLRINRTFKYSGTSKELYDFLQEMSAEKWYKGADYSIDDLGNFEFRVKSKFSFGTIRFFNSVSAGIYCKLKMDNPNVVEKNPIVKITTGIRIEHFFILVILAFITLKEGISFLLPALGITLFASLWFHIMYRWQENSLIDKVVYSCRLEEIENHETK